MEILTCGTCLNHYGLAEKRQVGGVTNMYEMCLLYTSYKSMAVTDRAMLSRGVSVIRKKTLIENLPGSPKAVSYTHLQQCRQVPVREVLLNLK